MEQTDTLREQALAAWEQRQQEITVNEERRRTEQTVRLIAGGTRAVLRALSEDGRMPDGGETLYERAGDAGVGVVGHSISETGFATATFSVDGIVLKWIVDGVIGKGRLVLVAECPDCGGDVEFGHDIIDIYKLGAALDDQRRDPKMLHSCPHGVCPATGGPHQYEEDSDEPNGRYVACVECKASPSKEDSAWEGYLTLAPAMAKADDPAFVLLGALQGYIHAAVDAAVKAKTPEEPF